MFIHPIKALSDNYIWCIQEETELVVIDPGIATEVLEYIDEQELHLTAILLTHMHEDHTGGVEEILEHHPKCLVYGPKETDDLANCVVQERDSFQVGNHTFQVYQSGGHTHGHISYLLEGHLFCGDSMFSAGCGRVFTGDYQTQYDTLQKFKHLADDIHVYPGHEYTETNLRFAHEIRPENKKVSKALAVVQELRANGQPTLPTTIGKEKEINLFLQAETMEDFIELRNARDHF